MPDDAWATRSTAPVNSGTTGPACESRPFQNSAAQPAPRRAWARPVEPGSAVVGCDPGAVASLVVNHRRYGGSTAAMAVSPVPELASPFHRTNASVLAKMAKVDGLPTPRRQAGHRDRYDAAGSSGESSGRLSRHPCGRPRGRYRPQQAPGLPQPGIHRRLGAAGTGRDRAGPPIGGRAPAARLGTRPVDGDTAPSKGEHARGTTSFRDGSSGELRAEVWLQRSLHPGGCWPGDAAGRPHQVMGGQFGQGKTRRQERNRCVPHPRCGLRFRLAQRQRRAPHSRLSHYRRGCHRQGSAGSCLRMSMAKLRSPLVANWKSPPFADVQLVLSRVPPFALACRMR